MPRAFLITHRRYNGTEEFQSPVRDYSPERGVRMAEYGGGQPTSDGVSDCGSETSSECPEELYNLTKLAEVSLAAAAGTLIHPSKVMTYERPLSPRWDDRTIDKYSVKHEIENSPRTSLQNLVSRDDFAPKDSSNDELSLRERTRLFFERIESEREILELRNHRANNDDSKIRSSRESSSPSRSQSQNDISDIRIVKISSVSFNDEPTIEESSKSVLTALTRKTNSSSLSSSEGSKSDDSEADHECPDCGKKYSTSSNLARHRQTHRSLGDKKARRCPHCDKIYVSMPAFSMHVRTHNQGCKCHYCGKCFSRPWLLQGHIRTHTGEKPFKCMICNKAFADKSNLRAHVQTHSNTKPHVCGRCGKAFALKSYLYKHEESSCMRAHNRGTSEKRETGNESCLNLAINSNSPTGRIFTPPITASPTSVIVQRPSRETTNVTSDSSPLAFSSIIRHTNNETIGREEISSPPVKRQCGVTNVDDKHESPKTIDTGNNSTLLSRMVIRTSVISPNPEHLSRLGGSLNAKKPFDFNDPTRTSAFSKPTTISLNLAIA